MFKDENEFGKIVEKLNIDTKSNPAHREKLKQQMLSVFNETSQKTTGTSIPDIWRIIMKSPITKIAAAAVIILTAGIFLYTNSLVPAAYALQDTINAYNSISSLHIKEDIVIMGWTKNIWFECDMNGNITRMRFNTPYCGEPVGSLAFVGNGKHGEAWLGRHNLHLVGYDNPDRIFGFDLAQVEPKGLIERLYKQQELGEIILDVNEPREKNKPIVVTVSYPEGSLSENWKKLFYIDQATKLVKKIDKFELRNGDYQHVATIEFSDYNQMFDPSMFSFENELPANAITVDMTGIDAGLLQGDMTDEEVVKEITRQFFEATIAGDFSRAGELYLGAPGDLIEQALMGIIPLEIISIGPAKPETDPDSKEYVCSCKILFKTNGQYHELDVSMVKVSQISSENEPPRWIIIGSSYTVNPISSSITLSKNTTDLDAVTYENPQPGDYLKKWLVLGPLPLSVPGDIQFDSEEGQKAAFDMDSLDFVNFTQKVTIDNIDYEWAALESEHGIVDLTQLSASNNDLNTAYIWTQIDMPKETTGTLGIGSDDGVKVWLNGELVHENWQNREVAPDDDHVPVTFRKGKNQLVLKVQNALGAWGFCCRLLDE